MRKQLHEIEEIDNYLFQKMDTPDRLLFEAKMIVAPELRKNLFFQRKGYLFIRWFGRKKQKEQLESMFNVLMEEQPFSSAVNSIFK